MSQTLINPFGEVWEVDDDAKAAALIQEGWQPEAPEAIAQRTAEAKYGDQDIRTAVESGLDEATFGLSTKIATGVFGVDPADIKGRQMANPTVDTVARIGGIGASLLLPIGPAGLVAKAGAKVAAKAGLKGIAAAAGAGMVEGGFYGAGRAISEDALDGDDAELTAEKLLSHIGGGMVVGGPAGAAGAAATKALGLGLKKVAGVTDAAAGSLPQWFREKAERNAVRAIGGLGPTGSQVSKVGVEKAQQVGRQLIDDGLVGKGFAETDAARKAAWEEMKAAIKPLDDAGPQFDLSAVVRRGREMLEGIDDPAQAAQKRVIKRILDGYEKIAEKGPIGLQKANDFGSSLGKTYAKTADDVTKRLHGDLGRIIEDEIQAQLPPQAKAAWIEANRKYSLYRTATDFAEKAEERTLGNRSVSLTDYIVGAGALGAGNAGPAQSIAGGLATSVVNNWARLRGSAVMAKAFDALSKNKGVERIAKLFHGRVNTLVNEAPETFGPYAPFISAAAAHSPVETLVAHAMAAESDPGYAEAMASAGFGPQEPGEEGAAYGLALGRSAVQQVADDHDKALTDHVGAFLDRRRPMRREKVQAGDFKSELDDLATLATRPEVLAQRIDPGGELAAVAPQVAAQVSNTAMRAAQFLHERAPKPPPPPTIPDYSAPEWSPARADLEKYRRYGRAIMRPLSVLEDIQRGELSREAAEGLRAVYPRLAEDISRRFVETIAERKARLTYQQRIQLGVLLGMPLDRSQETDTFKTYQGIYAQAQEAAQANAEKMKGAKMGQAHENLTMLQRMEGSSR